MEGPYPSESDDAASQASVPIHSQEIFGEEEFGEFVTETEPSVSESFTSLPKFYDRKGSFAFSRFDSSTPPTSNDSHSFEPLEMDNEETDFGGQSSPELGHDDTITESHMEREEREMEMEMEMEMEENVQTPSPQLHPQSPPPQFQSPSTSVPSTPRKREQQPNIHSIDRRFHTRMSSTSSNQSGNVLNKHLGSVSSLLFGKASSGNTSPSANASITTSANEELLLDLPYQTTPWEPIRWSKLRKISNQLYSETAYASYGHPTCVLAASFIAVGMSRGHVLVFDYQQTLKHVLGLKNKLPEWGQVTSLAASADNTFVGVGYSQGHILTWELSKPNSPNIHIHPLSNIFDLKPNDNKEGHIIGSSVIHLSFINKRHSALVSADSKGMAFAHDTVRNIRRHVKTKRILGRYKPQPNTKNRPMTVFACAPRMVVTADDLTLVALMTPYLLVVVSIHPQIRTQLKLGRSKDINNSMGLSAVLSWLPTSGNSTKLAYCWSNVVNILDISIVKDGFSDESTVAFSKNSKKLICDESIVAIQWINPQVGTRI